MHRRTFSAAGRDNDGRGPPPRYADADSSRPSSSSVTDIEQKEALIITTNAMRETMTIALVAAVITLAMDTVAVVLLWGGVVLFFMEMAILGCFGVAVLFFVNWVVTITPGMLTTVTAAGWLTALVSLGLRVHQYWTTTTPTIVMGWIMLDLWALWIAVMVVLPMGMLQFIAAAGNNTYSTVLKAGPRVHIGLLTHNPLRLMSITVVGFLSYVAVASILSTLLILSLTYVSTWPVWMWGALAPVASFVLMRILIGWGSLYPLPYLLVQVVLFAVAVAVCVIMVGRAMQCWAAPTTTACVISKLAPWPVIGQAVVMVAGTALILTSINIVSKYRRDLLTFDRWTRHINKRSD